MRALISVSNKEKLDYIAKELHNLGFELIATGGTYSYIRQLGIPVTKVEDITSFPEILNGRVKTLHPKIHGGILAKSPEDLKDTDIEPIDIVVVNLYPFEKFVGADEDTLIENIDIGGVALLRAAAKNYERVVVLSSPSQYEEAVKILKEGKMDKDTRRKYAMEAFACTAKYDALIYNTLWKRFSEDFPPHFIYCADKVMSLRYGENPHQRAAYYADFGFRFTQLHGKKLSYNNIHDMNAAWNIVMEFNDPAVAIIKHANPCGAALGEDVKDAYLKALESDPISAYGSIVASNRTVDKDAALEMKKMFIEVIIAPDFSDDALEILTRKKNLRLIKVEKWEKTGYDMKRVDGGLLVQEWDLKKIDALKTVSNRKPSEEELRDLIFGWYVVRHVKSNAIVFVKNQATVGVGAGQMSRVDSVKLARMKAGERAQGAVMASDAFFPFRDAIDEACAAGITAVIQPGGSKRDQEVIDAINEHGMAMVFTGYRVFKH